MNPFLTAEWRRLLIANFIVDHTVLVPYLPGGTQLDQWQGRCYVSVVGFMFLDTRVRGMAIPFHRDFEEANLRFYVKRIEPSTGETRRGVVFIRELVPKRALTFVANTLYGEYYATVPIRHEWNEEGDRLNVSYGWRLGGKWNDVRCTASSANSPMAEGSEAEFITEHYWGYTRLQDGRTGEYQVKHPRWNTHTVRDHELAVDFRACYGDRFAHLDGSAPASVMLAEGSAVQVMPRTFLSA